ncbi:MAG: hypothetical protein ABSD71_14375 [Bacteroidales bacterium]|jgi:hypothetical protein
MKIGTFRISSAKKIRKFLVETIKYREDHEWYIYIAIYESRILGMCFYRNLNHRSGTINKMLKDAQAEEREIITVEDIDMNAVLSNYQELAFHF